MDKFTTETSNFAFDIFKKISQKEENVFLSPFSISVALSILSSGTDGNSRQELINALHLNEFEDQNQINEAFKDVMKVLSKSTGCTVSLANRLYAAENFPVKLDFKLNLRDNYKSGVVSVNFLWNDVEKEINEWMVKKTINLVKDIFAPNSFDHRTRLVLVNAIYFKGEWLEKFIRIPTPGNFYLFDGESKLAPMMKLEKRLKHVEDEELDCQMLELLYKRERLAMYVILPEKRDGIDRLTKKLTAEKFESMRSSMKKTTVDAEIPIFKMRFRSNLVPVLNKLKVNDVFNESKADLSGMSSKKGLYVTEVVHEAYVSVDENGTEATAASNIDARFLSRSKHFHADHPFLFIIYDIKTNTMLFIGSLDDPIQ